MRPDCGRRPGSIDELASLGLDSIIGFTLPHNQGSRRVLEKAGFVYERDVVHAELLHARRCGAVRRRGRVN